MQPTFGIGLIQIQALLVQMIKHIPARNDITSFAACFLDLHDDLGPDYLSIFPG